MTSVIAVLAFVSGSSLVLWIWSRFWRDRRPLMGVRRPVGPDQDPVRMPGKTGYWEQLERAAIQAGLPHRRRHFQQLALVGTGVALLLVLLGLPLLALVAVLAGVLAPRVLVNIRRRQRAQQIQAQLPQALHLAASTLRAGGTLLQAVEAVAHQIPEPLGREFQVVLRATRLGTPVADALAQLHQRMPLPSVAAVAVVARVTGELGGDAAAAFDRLAQSVDEAEAFRSTIRAHTTEGRLSAMLVTGLPFLIMGALAAMVPDYFRPMVGSRAGQVLLVVCLISIAVGWSLIRRLTNPEEL